MDPVLEVLQERRLERRHIDRVCELFTDVEGRDVQMAFDMLMRLHRYGKEANSWSFRLLAAHDFEARGNQFEADLARKVSGRAHSLLAHMAQWQVAALKQRVARLPRYSDWGMVLTSLVLRIVAQYAAVEKTLRVALSRATLVRIHCELGELSGDYTEGEGRSLVDRYRYYVKQLLQALEGSKAGPEQEKMFRTVTDLRDMFSSFKEGRDQTAHPERAQARAQRDEQAARAGHAAERGITSDAAAAAAATAAAAAGIADPSSANTSDTSDTASEYSLASSASTAATTASEGSAVATAGQHKVLSAKIMGVWETAKTEESLRTLIRSGQRGRPPSGQAAAPSSQPPQSQAPSRRQSSAFPPQAGVSAGAAAGRRITGSGTTAAGAGAGAAAPNTSSVGTSAGAGASGAAVSVPGQPSKQVNVQMVGGRMMVVQGGRLVDMQEWLDQANGLKLSQAPMGLRPPPPQGRANIANSGFIQMMTRGW